MSKGATIALVIGGVGGAAALGIAYALSRAGAASGVALCVDTPQGCQNTATFASGSDVRATATLPSGSKVPVTIQAMHTDGSPFGVSLPWDVSSTGYAYTIDFGVITGPAVATFYALTTFADGSTAKSNAVTVTVLAPGAGGGGGGGGSCPGGTNTCQSDADCAAGQTCLGGCCGTPIPASIQILSNNGGSQDEGVPSIGVPVIGPSVCGWGALSFNPYGRNQYQLQGRLVDAGGNPVPSVLLRAHFQSADLQPVNIAPTDANGLFTLTYQFSRPLQGNASCPAPGQTVNAAIVDQVDFYLPNNTIIGTAVCTITVYITGI